MREKNLMLLLVMLVWNVEYLGTNYPDMDMISFGPNIKGAHSPDERAQISSAQKYWNFVLEILKQVPFK